MNSIDKRAFKHLIKFFREDANGLDSADPIVQELCREVLKWKNSKHNSLTNPGFQNGEDSLVYMKDDRLAYTFGNENFHKLFQLGQGELAGLTDADLFGADAAEDIQQIDRDILANPRTITFESDRLLNSQLVTHETTKAPYLDAAGNPIGIIGISRDITLKRLQAKAIHAELERKEKTLSRFKEAYFSLDISEKKVLQSGGEIRRIIGTDTVALLETPEAWKTYVDPRDHYRTLRALSNLRKGKRSETELRIKSAEGNFTTVSLQLDSNLGADDQVLQVDGWLLDIAHQKAPGFSLPQLANNRFRSSDLVFLLTPDRHQFLYMNIAASNLLGYSLKEIEQLHLDDILIRGPYTSPEGNGVSLRKGEVGFKTQSGNIIPTEMEFSYMGEAQNEYIMVIAQDISKRRFLEENNLQSQRKFELLFNKSIDAYFVIRVVEGAPQDILEINDAACRLLGYSRSELERMGPSDVLPLEISSINLEDATSDSSEWYPFRRTMLYRKDNSTVRVDLGFHATRIGQDQVLLAIARDMTEHEQAYESVRNSERKLMALFNAIPDMVININKSGKILGQKLSKSGKSGTNMELLFGATALEKMDLIFDLLPMEIRDQARDTIARVLQEQKNETIEFQTRGTLKRGRIRDFEARICPIDSEEIVVFVREITNRKRRNAAIASSEERLRLLYNSNPMMIINFGFDQRILSVNTSTLESLGYSGGELHLGLRKDLIHPDDQAHAEEHFQAYMVSENENNSGCEYRMRGKSGEFFWVEERARVTVDLKGRMTVVVSCEDITRRRKAEQAILESLKEKEILLREVHHRVKNNLQIINSVLSLQMAQYIDPELHQALKDSQNRILAMSLIHENLYRSEGISNIDSREYFRELCGHLFSTYNISPNDIQVEYFIDNIALELAHGIPLGLIANELVTNVIKYAFNDMNGGGKVAITLKEEADNILFSFADNGKGLPECFDPTTARSMGLRLIQILSRQLRGSFDFKTENGLRFELSFPKEELDE